MNYISRVITRILVVLIGISGISGSLCASVILFDLNDVVLDGNSGENTFITRNSTTAGSLVYNGGTPSLTYNLNSGSGFSYFSSYFDSQTLSAVGEGIEISYSFTPSSASAFKSQNEAFRVGLYDSKGTQVTSDSTSNSQTGFNDDRGYMALYSPNATPGSVDKFYQRTSNNSLLWSSGTRTAVSGSPELESPGTGSVTGLFRVELISPTSIRLTSQLNGSSSQSIVDLSGLDTSFDMVSFFAIAGGNSQSLIFDEITVSSIPEPSSLLLVIAAAAIPLVSRVRQRRFKR